MNLDIDQIFLDMDGVLVDWFGGVCDLLQRDRFQEENKWPVGASTECALQVDVDHMWNLINRHGSDWWANLDPLPWLPDLLKLLSGSTAQVAILTSPANSDHAASGKIRWLKKHLPDFVDGVHLTADKHRLAQRGTLLIDDCDYNCRDFIESGGQAIVFPQPWNEERVCRNQPVEYLKARLELSGIIS